MAGRPSGLDRGLVLALQAVGVGKIAMYRTVSSSNTSKDSLQNLLAGLSTGRQNLMLLPSDPSMLRSLYAE